MPLYPRPARREAKRDTERANVTRRLAVVLFAITCTFMVWTMGLIAIPLAAASLGAPPQLIGVLVGLPGVAALLTGSPVGALADALGRRPILLAGCVSGLAAALIMTTAGTLSQLAVGAGIFGIFLSLSVSPTLALLAETPTSDPASRVQGYNGAAQGAGALVGALVAGTAFDVAGSSAVFGIVAVLVAVILACHADIPPEVTDSWPGTRDVAASYMRSLRLIVDREALAASAMLAIIASAILFVVGNAFLPLYLVRVLEWPAAGAGALLAARSVALVVGSLGLSSLVRRFGVLGTALGAAATAALTLIPLGLMRDGATLTGLIVVQGLALGIVPGVANLLIVSATSRDDRALGFSAISFAGYLATTVLPIAIGLAMATWGESVLFVSGAACVAIPLVGLAFLVARSSHPGGYVAEHDFRPRNARSL